MAKKIFSERISISIMLSLKTYETPFVKTIQNSRILNTYSTFYNYKNFHFEVGFITWLYFILEALIRIRMITSFTSFDNLNFDWAKAKQSLKENLKDVVKVNIECAKGANQFPIDCRGNAPISSFLA